MADFRALTNSGFVIATSVVIKQSVVAIFGPIIPAPLVVPAIVTLAPEISNLRTARLALVSVVIIAFVKFCPALEESESFAAAFEMPAVILLIGNCSPIMPVEATRISRAVCCVLSIAFSELAVLLHIEIASLSPFWPVQVLALPELATTPYTVKL